MKLNEQDPDLWDAVTPALETSRGIYVAISGNTAAGKSTLIREVVERIRALGHRVIGVSERSFHHPYLTRMFSDPGRYAFPVQINFMLQRHLVLLRQLELGRSVVMERSHFDDQLFLREHVEAGNVSPDQAAAYRALARVLHDQLPVPDVFVLMNPMPELSLERLRLAEERGDRPREFPDEAAKERWVRRWHRMYQELHEEYVRSCVEDPRFSLTRLLRLDASSPPEVNVPTVVEEVLSRLDALGCPAPRQTNSGG